MLQSTFHFLYVLLHVFASVLIMLYITGFSSDYEITINDRLKHFNIYINELFILHRSLIKPAILSWEYRKRTHSVILEFVRMYRKKIGKIHNLYERGD